MTGSLLDRVVFTLGRQCHDEFFAVLLLCGNGLGIEALKLVRSLYERAVTMHYLTKFPDKVDKFVNYNAVNLGKLYHHVLGRAKDLSQLSKDRIEEIQTDYKNAEQVFKKQTWSRLDALTMAEKAAEASENGQGLNDLYGLCFFRPTLHTHPTALSFQDWIGGDDEGLWIKENAQHEMVSQSLLCAHGIIMHVLVIQDDYFKFGLEKELSEQIRDYPKIWSKIIK